jgi:hypothetical protein
VELKRCRLDGQSIFVRCKTDDWPVGLPVQVNFALVYEHGEIKGEVAANLLGKPRLYAVPLESVLEQADTLGLELSAELLMTAGMFDFNALS